MFHKVILFFSPPDATGLAPDHETETEVEEAVATTTGVVLETESVQDVSEPKTRTSAHSLIPESITVFFLFLFLSFYPTRFVLGISERQSV